MSAGEQLPPVAPSDGGSAGGSSIDELQVRLTSLGGDCGYNVSPSLFWN